MTGLMMVWWLLVALGALAAWVANGELRRRHEREMREMEGRQATLRAEDEARLKRLELREKQLGVLENVAHGARWSDAERAEGTYAELRRLMGEGGLERFARE